MRGRLVNSRLAAEAHPAMLATRQPPMPHPDWKAAPGALLPDEAQAYGYWTAHRSEGFKRPEPWRDGWWLVPHPRGKPVPVEPLRCWPLRSRSDEPRRTSEELARRRRAEIEREERVERARQGALL